MTLGIPMEWSQSSPKKKAKETSMLSGSHGIAIEVDDTSYFSFLVSFTNHAALRSVTSHLCISESSGRGSMKLENNIIHKHITNGINIDRYDKLTTALINH